MSDDVLARYRDHAERVAAEFGPGHHGREALADAIARVIHEFVSHDMEWAALAVEQMLRAFEETVASIRARGQGR